jgi:hypothetical protein
MPQLKNSTRVQLAAALESLWSLCTIVRGGSTDGIEPTLFAITDRLLREQNKRTKFAPKISWKCLLFQFSHDIRCVRISEKRILSMGCTTFYLSCWLVSAPTQPSFNRLVGEWNFWRVPKLPDPFFFLCCRLWPTRFCTPEETDV